MTGKKKTYYSYFRINIAQQLPEYSVRGRPSPSTTLIRLEAKARAHFPMHIPSTEKKKKSQNGVLCATVGVKGVKLCGSAKSVGLLFI
jgi:hypothetical protein